MVINFDPRQFILSVCGRQFRLRLVISTLARKKESTTLLPANQDIFSFDEKSNKIVSFGDWHRVYLVDHL